MVNEKGESGKGERWGKKGERQKWREGGREKVREKETK